MKNVNTINGIQSPQLVLSKKINVFFETEFETDIRKALNSICLPPFHNRKISEYHKTILKEAFDGKISET